ncbi:hypothetical protein DW228_06685 [Bacteroides fragilis]|uniref:DNA mismatch repair protein MutS-like N-terminal domain-containing protein n=1 Tax=Bacteroides fragilis TaxID=817 RepID=A0A396C881_BACFG|nr:hypothetical protein [Bacteroides fragilis]RHH14480.1 hypothetical protein DW228_06685 [Bacteroides fragilis]
MNNPITYDIIDNDYIINIYNYMKQKHGNDLLILFHVGKFYESYIADSIIVANILKRPRILLEKHMEYVIHVTQFPERELDNNVKQLLEAGYGTVISDMIGGKWET